MKQYISFFLLLPLIGIPVFGQKLIVPMTTGGNHGQGTLLELDLTQQILQSAHHFAPNPVGGPPADAPLVEWGGRLYGVNLHGGQNKAGSLFAVDTATRQVEVLAHFAAGHATVGGVVLYQNSLYGLYRKGCDDAWGDKANGGIYRWDLSTGQLSEAFCMPPDSTGYLSPQGGLVAANGRLYGVASPGLPRGGVIFSWQPDSGIYRQEAAFDSAGLKMEYNQTQLTLFGDKCYGVAIDSTNTRYVFEFSLQSKQLLTKSTFYTHRFNGKFYIYNNIFYTVTQEGGPFQNGMIFTWDPVASALGFVTYIPAKYGLLASFAVVGQSFFAVSQRGDINDLTNPIEVVEWNPATKAFTAHYRLDPWDEGYPNPSLVQIGNCLYGTGGPGSGPSGGTAYGGTVFRWSLTDSQYTHLAYIGPKQSGYPVGGLTMHQDKFYGVCPTGRSWRHGNIFSWDSDSQRVAYHVQLPQGEFDGISGSMTLLNGRLYGVCATSGAGQHGSLFAFDPKANTVETCLAFDSLLMFGRQPVGSLTALNGKLYGITREGFNYLERGTLFEFDPATRTFVSLYAFDLLSGLFARPAGGLVAWNGKLYGIANDAQIPDKLGYLYEFDPVTLAFTIRLMLEQGAHGTPTVYNNHFCMIVGGGSSSSYIAVIDPQFFVLDATTIASWTFGQLENSIIYDHKLFSILNQSQYPYYARIQAWHPDSGVFGERFDLCPAWHPHVTYPQTGCPDTSLLNAFALYDPTNAIEEPLSPPVPLLRVWPNPAREGWISVAIDPALQQKNLYIHDVTGREVAHREISGIQGKVSVEGLPPGIYWARMGTAAARFVVE